MGWLMVYASRILDFKNSGSIYIIADYALLVEEILGYGIVRGFDIPGAVYRKMEYNKTRPYRHGGKLF
jgi:hypothetical protein